MSSDLPGYLAELKRLVDDALTRAWPEKAPALINEAMQYAVAGGGKRLRPSLALAVADAVAPGLGLSVPHARALTLPSACALELVHTYSLVHDDLPAMDDDDLRRGRPTSHVVYGDGLAILAGDGLLTEAFRLIAESPSPVVPAHSPELPAARRVHAIEVLARAAGAVGMVGGQAIDLEAAGLVKGRAPRSFSAAALEDMHARKTGALIRASCALGAIAVGADARLTAAIDHYATELGLAFQIVDDILDVEGSAAALGKTAGKDAAAGKPTYPALYGVAESRRLAANCVERAKSTLSAHGLHGHLEALADWSLGRKN